MAQSRRLGRNGPRVSALGFGAMGLSIGYGATEPDEDRFKVLDRAYELGQTLWDSADVYGDSEDLIGKWFRRTGKRDDIVLATKFALTVQPDYTVSINSDPAYVREACAKSLKRLGVETIDLYYCHRVDGKTPVEKIVQEMVELKKEGKIRHLGLSEISSATLRRAHKVHPIAAVQVEYSPFTTDIEDPRIALLQTCCELDVAVVAYSPLGRGFLTGRYKSRDNFEPVDSRLTMPRFSAENFSKNLELVDTLADLAKKKSCTTGQLTLAWLLAQGEDIIPIPGTKKIKYLEENWGALEVVLTEQEKKEIRAAVDRAVVHGDRAQKKSMAQLFADTPELD